LKHKVLIFPLILISFLWLPTVAQEDVVLPSVGDIPLASKIQVNQDEDDRTIAVIRGEVGAVFPNAFVVVQNLYTQDRKTSNATSNGDFTISLYGQKQTPYWISAFQRFPSDADIDTAIGTVVYGEGEANSFYLESDLGGSVPRYRLIGDFANTQIQTDDDWYLNLAIEMDVADNFVINGLRLSGQITLQPVLDDSEPPIILSDTVSSNVSSTDTSLRFDLNFDALIPEISTEGRYHVQFMGYVQTGDSERELWTNSILLGTHDVELSSPRTSFPIWLLNQETPVEDLMWSILPDAHMQTNRSFHKLPIYTHTQVILPPDTYSIEALWVDALNMPIDDGQMSVSVLRPDGRSDQIDTDIIQSERQLNDDNITLATSSTILEAYPFTDYGDYEIQMLGRLRLGENVYYAQQATYQISIAEPLNLSPSMLAGTPLKVGDTIPVGVHLLPQFPVDVTADITLTALDGAITHMTQEGQANDYGYFAGEPIAIEQAGTYKIEYQASYTDTEGKLWSGDVVSIGVIANLDGDIMAYGQRGIAGYDGVGQAWFDTTIYPSDDVTATQQPYYPYYSGDIAYIPDAPDSGIYPRLTKSTDSEESYITVTRPDVILRQFIADDNDSAGAFNGEDTFNQQIGAGVDGIRAGDYAFLFGGVVSEYDSAIYGALVIVEDEDEPSRILSPFIDPLSVYGRQYDLFFVPTGARPAQVLTVGERLSIAGQVAPTLPTEVTVSLISPSGHRTQFSDVANAIGYFYSPENDFELDQIGVWQIDIDLTYRSETSLGQLERPYPVGQLSYEVYVVPPNNPRLGEAEFATETSRITKTYAPVIPQGWTDVRAFATITTPSAILAYEELTVFPAGTSYTYNPTTLARNYPNIELLDTTDGNHVADVLTLTLAMTGTDADGNPAINTRTYSITHDVTYAVDEENLR
jgi:hypothetical protein